MIFSMNYTSFIMELIIIKRIKGFSGSKIWISKRFEFVFGWSIDLENNRDLRRYSDLDSEVLVKYLNVLMTFVNVEL